MSIFEIFLLISLLVNFVVLALVISLVYYMPTIEEFMDAINAKFFAPTDKKL